MNKVKEHFKRNKKVYLGLGVDVGIGVLIGGVGAGTAMYLKKAPEVDNTNILQNQALLNIKPNIEQHNNYITQLVRRGHPGNVVRCVETGEEFASQSRAAELLGISRQAIGECLKGKREHIKGLHFELVGDAGELLSANIS